MRGTAPLTRARSASNRRGSGVRQAYGGGSHKHNSRSAEDGSKTRSERDQRDEHERTADRLDRW